MFRRLKESEIEVRVGMTKDTGISLLLYKNARADMNILDETVGALNWSRTHEEIDGCLYCSIGIRDKTTGEWTFKSDLGTESNTEKEKGKCSDAFKRAAVTWGIGRELYTAPMIFIKGGNKNDRFKVISVGYSEEGEINDLVIARTEWGKVKETVFDLNNNSSSYQKPQNDNFTPTDIQKKTGISDAQIKRLFAIGYSAGISKDRIEAKISKDYLVDNIKELDRNSYNELCDKLQKIADEKAKVEAI